MVAVRGSVSEECLGFAAVVRRGGPIGHRRVRPTMVDVDTDPHGNCKPRRHAPALYQHAQHPSPSSRSGRLERLVWLRSDSPPVPSTHGTQLDRCVDIGPGSERAAYPGVDRRQLWTRPSAKSPPATCRVSRDPAH